MGQDDVIESDVGMKYELPEKAFEEVRQKWCKGDSHMHKNLHSLQYA